MGRRRAHLIGCHTGEYGPDRSRALEPRGGVHDVARHHRLASSGLPGPKGNIETFVWCAREGGGIEDLAAAIGEVDA